MTLRTLKPKENNSLILDDEFLQYCKLNNIEDIEKFAREVFNRGFTIIKYGIVPNYIKADIVVNAQEESAPSIKGIVERYSNTKDPDEKKDDPPVVVIPKTVTKQMEQKQIQNMKKKADLYDE
jgi:hypothetical protein